MGMKRLLWLGVGLAVGALVVRAVSKKARALRPEGIVASARNSAGGLVAQVRSFVDDVRDGMHEREDQIHAAFAEGTPVDLDPEYLDSAQLGPEEGSYR
jgi:hypothetical protein